MKPSGIVRLLPTATASGAENMARDEALLHSASAGIASLRFYHWSAPTVSLGYFQPHACREQRPELLPLAWVRRPSGGLTLVHDDEVTYALALPPGAPWQDGTSWLVRMHRILAAALAQLGVHAALQEGAGAASDDILCFHHVTHGDLHINGHKCVGSAQRKYRGALLQHGAILLGTSVHTPTLPGLHELAGVRLSIETLAQALSSVWHEQTHWTLHVDDWSKAELDQAAAFVRQRYSSSGWNDKR